MTLRGRVRRLLAGSIVTTITQATPATNRQRVLLGHVLVQAGRLSPAQLAEALALQRRDTRRLGELLQELGHIDIAALRAALASQAGVVRAALEQVKPEAALLEAVPAELALRHKVLPLSQNDGTLTLAMADPLDRAALDAVRLVTGKRIERRYCPEPELLDAARRFYGSNVARMIADLDASAGDAGGDESASATELQELAREPSVVNLVNLIIAEAIEARASDVHVEPFEKAVKVKYRIDGLLQEMPPAPRRLQPAIISRIKIMAGMNIAERFVPQDGHIPFSCPRGKVDIRVATVPTVYGECVAMRLLDRSAGPIDLSRLGFAPHIQERFAAMLDRPHGIVLVTGPTGSGKTTTLYAALGHIYTPGEKIITIEDPVEYQIEGVNQIAVNRKRGIDFANGLRAILRQDPDIIMVGEIRDRETADIAIRSALTGHMVFSTLHTNDAPGAVTRLLDMGIEPFLLASSLEGVLAQRLVRTICPVCKEPQRPDPVALQRIGGAVEGANAGTFYHGRGCRQCRQTGYFGRTGIFELLRVTEPVRQVILRSGSANQIATAAPDHQPMRADGLRRVRAGETTIEEVLRVTQDAQGQEADESLA